MTTKYVVYLTSPDDCKGTSPHSFGSGTYGFTVQAADLNAAIAATIERAKAEKIYGYDWLARIVPVVDGRAAGHPLAHMGDAGIRLRDGDNVLWPREDDLDPIDMGFERPHQQVQKAQG